VEEELLEGDVWGAFLCDRKESLEIEQRRNSNRLSTGSFGRRCFDLSFNEPAKGEIPSRITFEARMGRIVKILRKDDLFCDQKKMGNFLTFGIIRLKMERTSQRLVH